MLMSVLPTTHYAQPATRGSGARRNMLLPKGKQCHDPYVDTLQMMRVFARVAQRGSFTAAAEDLRMSRAAVTKHVASLEEEHSVRLLDRTTRSVRMTEAGRLYLERCLECLQAFDDSKAAIEGLASEPKGLLRVAAPFDLGRHLHELIAGFLAAHPSIDIDVRLSNRTLDMVDEGIDVYVRISNSLDADSYARRLASTRLTVFGARRYFRTRSRPRTPADLVQHRFAIFDEPPLLDEWSFERGGRSTKVRLRPRIVSNGGELLIAAVSEGAMLGVFPSILLRPEHRRLLEPVLLDWSLGDRGVYAVYPHRRFVTSKVRAFVDFCRSALGDGSRDPWWAAAKMAPSVRDTSSQGS